MCENIFCVHVDGDENHSRIIQEVAFKCGYKWRADKDQVVQLTFAKYLFFNRKEKEITWSDYNETGKKSIDALLDFDEVISALLEEPKPDWRYRFYKALDDGKTIAYKFPWHKEDPWAIAAEKSARFYLDCADPEKPKPDIRIKCKCKCECEASFLPIRLPPTLLGFL